MAIETGELEGEDGHERGLHALRDAHNAMRVFVAIIMAVALKEALEEVLIGSSGSVKLLNQLAVEELVLFGVFIVVLGRFFIGDLRHLDAAHFESMLSGDSEPHAHRPLYRFIDLHLLLVRGILLVYLALSLHEFHQFFVLYMGILLIDILWVGIISRIGGSDATLSSIIADRPEFKWGLNSLTFLVLLGGLFVIGDSIVALGSLERYLFAALVILNSGLDYRLAWHYYFPNPSSV